METKKPVFLLAFAQNDQQPDSQDALAYVRKEAATISEIVNACAELRLEVVGDITAANLARAVLLYFKDLFLFHYSGHANEHNLIVDGFVNLDKTNLARMLAPQGKSALSIVFLSGCLSYGLVGALTSKGVKAVIATNTKIGDKHASEFAELFYQCFFAQGFALKDAFDFAATIAPGQPAKIVVVKPGETDITQIGNTVWCLFVHEKHTAALEWTVQDFLAAPPQADTSQPTQTPTTTQSHTGKGDNIGGNKWLNPTGMYRPVSTNNQPKNLDQTHSGDGDNIGGDKIIQ